MIRYILHKTAIKTILILSVFVVFNLIYTPPVSIPNLEIVLTVTSFIFGYYLVTNLANSKTKLDKVLDHLKDTEGKLINMNLMVKKTYSKEIYGRLQKMTDKYLIATIDYKLTEYSMSSQDAKDIESFLLDLPVKNDNQSIIKDQVLTASSEFIESRSQIEVYTQDRISTVEWAILIVLLIVMVVFINLIPLDSQLLAVVIKSILSATLITMVLILKRIDDHSWNKDRWVWDSLINTFHELGLMPYFPKPIFDSGEAKPPAGIDYRLADYPNKYPDMSGKIVEIINASKSS